MVSSISSVLGFGATAMAQMREALFNKLDADGDGSVSKAEFGNAATANGTVAEEDIESAFSNVDTDGDGVISRSESDTVLKQISDQMQSMLLSLQETGGNERRGPKSMLEALDSDGDGSLTEAEFLAGKPSDITDERAAALFGKLDADADGTISTSEAEAAEKSRPHGHGGPPPMGPPPGASGKEEDEEEDNLISLLDSDGDGTVTASELTSAAESAASALFAEIDADGDGSITDTESESFHGTWQKASADRFGGFRGGPDLMGVLLQQQELSQQAA